MSVWNTVVLTRMTLRLVPEILDTVDVLPLVCEELAVIDSDVAKVE